MESIRLASELLGGQSALARALGVSPAAVSQWMKGLRAVPPPRCTAIERLTDGRVSRRDLRPSDWAVHWPELAGSAVGLPAAAGAEVVDVS